MKIIGVFKTHFDYGYTDLQVNILHKYRNEIIDKVIETCDKSEYLGEDLRYKWTLPSWLLMDIYDNQTGVKKEKLKSLIENDIITCHSLPFTVHSELLTKNQLDDLFIPVRRYMKEFGKEMPISAKMTDVPGHTMAIIEPLVKNGVKFLHLGKNPYCTGPDVPLLFFWEDKKGNRILTMYNQFYGSNVLPPKGWKYPVWMALNQTGDNAGGHDVSVILDMKKKVGKKNEFMIGSMDDFAKELLELDLSDVPVIRGELGDTWIHGAGNYPDVYGRYRRAREEFYEVMEYAKAKNVDISGLEEEFKDQSLQYTEHTFGINICRYIGYDREYERKPFEEELKSGKYDIALKSWDEQRERVYLLERLLKEMKEAIHYEKAIVKTPIDTRYKLKLDGKNVIVTLPSGREIRSGYKYSIKGADKLHKYMKEYMVRFSDWSTVDLGKERYPEIDDMDFKPTLINADVCENEITLFYRNNKRSYTEYGNCKDYSITYRKESDGVHVYLKLNDKIRTPFVESGTMFFKLNSDVKDYIVDISGLEIDVNKDIVKNANTKLWSMDKYARMDNVYLYSKDASLVSFGEDPIMMFTGGKMKKKKPSFVINLFNNQWGTNFPQWTEGTFEFEFILKEE